MTHDDLRRKLKDRYWKIFNYNSMDQSEEAIEHRLLIQKHFLPLQAIVELHEPVWYGGEVFCTCSPSVVHWGTVKYPCRTIQAIEKELQ